MYIYIIRNLHIKNFIAGSFTAKQKYGRVKGLKETGIT